MSKCEKCGHPILGNVVSPGEYASFVQQREAWEAVCVLVFDLGIYAGEHAMRQNESGQDHVLRFIRTLYRQAEGR